MSYLHLAFDEPAFVADLSGLGRERQRPGLFTGQYGIALAKVDIPLRALRLLALSKTFRRMVETLDKAYISFDQWNKSWKSLTLNADNRIVGGRFGGRRVLFVGRNDAGSLFSTPPKSNNIADAIWFSSSLPRDDAIPWIEVVAHESVHAFARVARKGKRPEKPSDRVRAAVLDECNTRKIENKVLAEIRATRAGREALARHPIPGPVRTCDCERDWFPAHQKRTYLEQFVLDTDWESEAKAFIDSQHPNTASTALEKLKADVAAIPLPFSAKEQPPTMVIAILRGTAKVGSFAKQFPVLASSAAQAALVLRIVDASWRQLIAKVGEGSFIWTGGAHQLRMERHARVFFKIDVGYTKCP